MKISFKVLSEILGYNKEAIVEMLDETETDELQLKVYINVRKDERGRYSFDWGELDAYNSFVADYSKDKTNEDWEWESMNKWLY